MLLEEEAERESGGHLEDRSIDRSKTQVVVVT